MDNIFELGADIELDNNSQPPKMTKDEFIENTRSMLKVILDKYIDLHRSKFTEDDEENSENTCSKCNGFTHRARRSW
jgi:hypothetical protein